MSRTRIALYLATILLLLVAVAAWYITAFMHLPTPGATAFDGQRALRDVQTQVSFGPRVPGSEAHGRAIVWMESELAAAGWTVRRQETTALGHPVTNVIARRGTETPQLILGAHYDTRLLADRDPDPAMKTSPGPGANDGGSGVAVILELARTLPPETVPLEIVLFDVEDNGRIPGWDWCLGSRAFVDALEYSPQAMVLVDMVGDRELSMPMEGSSDPTLRASIWATASRMGHASAFRPEIGGAILDDHEAFLEQGIPAVDLIDIEYPYWHTSEDTVDKLSAESLQTVGDVLWTWLVEWKQAASAPGG